MFLIHFLNAFSNILNFGWFFFMICLFFLDLCLLFVYSLLELSNFSVQSFQILHLLFNFIFSCIQLLLYQMTVPTLNLHMHCFWFLYLYLCNLLLLVLSIKFIKSLINGVHTVVFFLKLNLLFMQTSLQIWSDLCKILLSMFYLLNFLKKLFLFLQKFLFLLIELTFDIFHIFLRNLRIWLFLLHYHFLLCNLRIRKLVISFLVKDIATLQSLIISTFIFLYLDHHELKRAHFWVTHDLDHFLDFRGFEARFMEF